MKRTTKAVAAGSAGVILFGTMTRARRRARLRDAAIGFVDAVEPGIEVPGVEVLPPPADEAHAPGHAHRHAEQAEQTGPGPAILRSRPFAKHHRGLRHPGRGD